MRFTVLCIELLYFMAICSTLGMQFTTPVVADIDNKGAYDLCYRDSVGANSRHVDRKVYKSRELRALNVIKPRLVPTDDNWADIFTKPLMAKFAGFRNYIMNMPGTITDAYNVYKERKKAKAAAKAAARDDE
jgi:hypothetical protein